MSQRRSPRVKSPAPRFSALVTDTMFQGRPLSQEPSSQVTGPKSQPRPLSQEPSLQIFCPVYGPNVSTPQPVSQELAAPRFPSLVTDPMSWRQAQSMACPVNATPDSRHAEDGVQFFYQDTAVGAEFCRFPLIAERKQKSRHSPPCSGNIEHRLLSGTSVLDKYLYWTTHILDNTYIGQHIGQKYHKINTDIGQHFWTPLISDNTNIE